MPSDWKPAETRKVTLTFTTELSDILRNRANDTFGNRKGALSLYIEMVLRTALSLKQHGVEEA